MEIKKEVLPKSKVKLTVKLLPAEMRAFFARVYNRIAPQIEVKGFRPGQAPRSMIISAIGENRLQSEIVDEALKESYGQALKKENLVPVSPPKVNLKMMKDLLADTAEMEYEAEVDLLPEVKIGKYKEIRIKKERKEIKIAKEEIEQVLSHLARGQAQFKDIDRPIKQGDRVEINFEAFDNGVKLENLSSKNYPVILGSKVLIPEFEEKLIGLKKGDKKEFKLHLSPNSQEKTSAKGGSAVGGKKEIDFKVEILLTQEVILPKFDDEFAQKYKKKNMAELKSAIENDVIKQKEIEQRRALENEMLEKLIKITKVEVPESLIEQEIARQISQIRSRVSTAGLSFEQYLNNLKKTEEELKEGLKPQAEKTIKIGLALGEIAKLEKIDPKDKEAGKKAFDKLYSYATK